MNKVAKLILNYADGTQKIVSWGDAPAVWEEPDYDREIEADADNGSSAMVFDRRTFTCVKRYERFGTVYAHYYEDIPPENEEAPADAPHGADSPKKAP